jgi:radical SAM superfamily enzyme YgiQ (UPF0313 family)
MPNPAEWQSVSDLVPIGLLYLAEACRARGHEPLVVQLHDAAAALSRIESGSRWGEERWKELIGRLLGEWRPSAVGVQLHWSYQNAGAAAVARIVKEIDPGIHVTLGGVHASALSRAILDAIPAVDSVVVGDGDTAYPQLLDALKRGADGAVPGVLRRCADGSVAGDGGAASPAPADVPVLTFDSDLVWPPGRGRYVGLPFMRGRCPKPCTFCSLNSQLLYPELQRSLERQLEEQVPIMVARGIPMYLPENYAGPKPLEALTRVLEGAGRASAIFVDIHPAMVNARVAAALGRLETLTPRLRVWLGVESGSHAVRERAGRRITRDGILEAFDRLAGAGVARLQSSVMVGLPGETEAEVAESDALIGELNARGILANVLPCVAFPETDIFRRPDHYGIRLAMREVADFDRLSLGWFAPISGDAISFATEGMDASARVEATLKLRLRQRTRLGYRVTPELFRAMEHLPGLRVPGEGEAMTEHYARLLESPRFGGPVRPERFWTPEDQR